MRSVCLITTPGEQVPDKTRFLIRCIRAECIWPPACQAKLPAVAHPSPRLCASGQRSSGASRPIRGTTFYGLFPAKLGCACTTRESAPSAPANWAKNDPSQTSWWLPGPRFVRGHFEPVGTRPKLPPKTRRRILATCLPGKCRDPFCAPASHSGAAGCRSYCFCIISRSISPAISSRSTLLSRRSRLVRL